MRQSTSAYSTRRPGPIASRLSCTSASEPKQANMRPLLGGALPAPSGGPPPSLDPLRIEAAAAALAAATARGKLGTPSGTRSSTRMLASSLKRFWPVTVRRRASAASSAAYDGNCQGAYLFAFHCIGKMMHSYNNHNVSVIMG